MHLCGLAGLRPGCCCHSHPHTRCLQSSACCCSPVPVCTWYHSRSPVGLPVAGYQYHCCSPVARSTWYHCLRPSCSRCSCSTIGTFATDRTSLLPWPDTIHVTWHTGCIGLDLACLDSRPGPPDLWPAVRPGPALTEPVCSAPYKWVVNGLFEYDSRNQSTHNSPLCSVALLVYCYYRKYNVLYCLLLSMLLNVKEKMMLDFALTRE